MTTWSNIYSIINAEAKLYDNVVDLSEFNGGFIEDNYKTNSYEFTSHNYVVNVDKNMKDEYLLEIFDAYLQDADAFDEVIDKYNLLKFTDNTYVSVFEFISPLTLVAKYDKFNFDNHTYIFDFDQNFWKNLSKALSFNKSTDKIDYAFAVINTNYIYDDSKCITLEWTVYSLPDNNEVTSQDAKKFIIDNLIQRFNTSESLLIDNNYYLNFGLNFIELD